MRPRPLARRRRRPVCEPCERRLLLVAPDPLTVPLDPTFDQFGDQVVAVQSFDDPGRAAFSIFDTGASAVTFAATDQEIFEGTVGGIPIRIHGGAIAEGIGGQIVGDVSAAGLIFADGIHAAELSFDDDGFPQFELNFTPESAATAGIQAFVGTEAGSPILPTITGTPILYPSPAHPNGLAARIDLRGYLLDFGDIIPDLVLAMPDLHFVAPGTVLAAAEGTTEPITLDLTPFGLNNFPDPGDMITDTPLALQEDVSLADEGHTVGGQAFLYDTGAQLSVISEAAALALGLDLNNPETSITVQGVAGSVEVPGYTLEVMSMPRADGGTLRFTDVPIYVLDIAPGIDGIMGMNLFNTTNQMLFDPHDPSGPTLQLTFFTDPDRDVPPDFEDLDALAALGIGFTGAIGGTGLPNVGLPPVLREAEPADFDGDRKADLGVYRPTSAEWLIDQSSAGPLARQFGAAGVDVPLQGDFDGDGKLDLAVFRPTSATWLVLQSGGGTIVRQFGAPGIDVPVPADYDGDGATDLAVYRPISATWFILRSTDGPLVRQFGAPRVDRPMPADYDGDGATDLAVFRPQTAEWLILLSGGGARVKQFGAPGVDRPIPADYDGDRKADLAVYRPVTATWLILQSNAGPRVEQFGAPNVDLPVPADYDGDGKIDVAIYRPPTGLWAIRQSSAGSRVKQFGAPNVDVPLALPLSYRDRTFVGIRSIADASSAVAPPRGSRAASVAGPGLVPPESAPDLAGVSQVALLAKRRRVIVSRPRA